MLEGGGVDANVHLPHRELQPFTVADIANEEAQSAIGHGAAQPLLHFVLFEFIAREHDDAAGFGVFEQRIDKTAAKRSGPPGDQHRQPVECLDAALYQGGWQGMAWKMRRVGHEEKAYGMSLIK